MKKRALSLFMALVLCLTLLPAPAWAAEDGAPENGGDDAAQNSGIWADGVQYDSINDALDRYPKTVDVYEDVEESIYPIDSVTINMNGHSITGDLEVYVSMTLNNGSVNGDVTVVMSDEYEFILTAPSDADAAIAGELYVSGGLSTDGGYSVSVNGAGRTVLELLPEGYAYAAYDQTTGDAGAIVRGDVSALDVSVIVVEHQQHSVQPVTDESGNVDYICECGYHCPHNSFTDGRCDICGAECMHDYVTESGDTAACDICGMAMAVKAEKGDGTVTYYARTTGDNTDNTLSNVFSEASGGDTITLLTDGLSANATVSRGKTITLNLNGKNLIDGQGITVAYSEGDDNKLIVTGTAKTETPENYYDTPVTFHIDGGMLEFDGVSGTIGGVRVNGGALTIGENNEDLEISTLKITGSAEISLQSGEYGKIAAGNELDAEGRRSAGSGLRVHVCRRGQ